MSREEEGLLHDVCANPEDVAPRLVYADWLDERGQKGDAERAEFIRLQCRLGEAGDAAQTVRLRKREAELEKAWGTAWRRPLRPHISRCEFRRGFVERATIQASAFLDHGAAFMRLTPLRVVKLRDPKIHIDDLTGARTLARLAGLSLNSSGRPSSKIGAARARTLLSSPHLANLRWLDLGNCSIGVGGLEALLEATPRLPSLRCLSLEYNNLRDSGVAALAGSALLAQLEGLNLDNNDITAAGARALASAPAASRLRHLHLKRNRDLGAQGLRELLDSPHLAGLKKVYLQGCDWDERDRRRFLREFGHRVELDFLDRDITIAEPPLS
jgi:uncharacterized protein (TIGR02996 family)